MFHALRYKNGGEICVVTGPITKPREVEDKTVYHYECNLVVPLNEFPVICCGLVSASHLNGRGIGRNDGSGIRMWVYFEKKGLKSALVKPENLHIAFELPSKKY